MSYNLPLLTLDQPVTLSECRVSQTHSENLLRNYIAMWHSGFDDCPKAFKAGFVIEAHGRILAVAVWGRPVTNNEDQENTLELWRYAIGPDKPRNLGTWGLARMRRWIKQHLPERTRLISYQDADAHDGALYKADNWQFVYEKFGEGDWSQCRPGRKGSQRQHKIKWERRP